ncbi:MAG: tetratricopeptide repeat protein [Planctomycetes bacterium]|nr:tetratricopeptide repeat protein [Planctomycetota bacterium]
MTPRRPARVNWKALVVLSLVLCLGGTAAYFLHGYRVRTAVRRALIAGNTAYDRREFTKAAAQLGRYLSAHPEDIQTLLKYADSQLRRRPQSGAYVQQAVNALEQILRQNPAEAETAGKLIDLYLLTQDKVGARRIADGWYSAVPTEPLARRALVRALIAQAKDDEYAKALERIREWRTSSADEPFLLRLEASVLAAQNQVERARQTLEQLIARHPEDFEGAADLASLLWLQNEKDQAEAVLNRAVDRSPQSAEARMARARLLILSEKRDQARSDLEEAVRLAGGNIRVLLPAGSLLADAGFIEAAGTAFEEAAKVEPHNAVIYETHAAAVLEAGNVEAGAALADRALSAPLGEQRFDVLEPAAELYSAASRPVDVRKCLDQLRAANAPAAGLLYVEGLAAMAEDRPFEAVEKLELAVQQNPRHARARLLLGRALRQTGSLRRAVGPLREYIRLRQESGKPAVTAQIDLARLHISLGQIEEATKIASEMRLSGVTTGVANVAYLTRLELMAEAARPGGIKPDPRLIDEMTRQVEQLSVSHPKAVSLQVLHARLISWQGKRDEAVAMLRDMQSKSDDKLSVGRVLIDLFAEAKEYEKAIAEAAHLLSAGGLEKNQAFSLSVRLAELHAQAGQVAEAKKLLEETITRAEGRGRSPIRLELARLLARHGQVDAAREVLLQAIAEDERDLPCRLLLVSLDLPDGKGPDRQTLADQIKSVEGQAGINWRYAQAVAYLNPPKPPGDWNTYPHRKAAETLLLECLAKDPSWEAAAVALGTLYERTGEENKAIDAYRSGLSANPGSVLVARRLAMLVARAQRWDEVDRVLRALPADDPLSRRLQLMLAVQQGERDRSIKLLRDVVAQDKEGSDVAARLQLSTLLRETDEVQEAEGLLQEAARIAPDSPEVLAARVRAHLGKGEFEPARELCEGAIAKEPRADEYQLLAQVHEAADDLPSAEAVLRRMVLSKDFAEAGHLSLGRLFYRRANPAKAIECWREGLSAVPQSRLLRSAMAEAMLAGHNKEQAAEAGRMLDELIAERPDDLAVLLLRADYLYRGDPAKGEAELDRLEQLRREDPSVLRKRLQFAARNAQAAEARGLAAEARTQRVRAIELADRALRSAPRDTDLLLLKSGMLISDNPSLAAATARQALDIAPGSEAAMLAYLRAVASRTPPSPVEVEEALKVGRTFLSRSDTARAVDVRLAMADLHGVLPGSSPESRQQADALISQAAEIAPRSPQPVLARLRWHAAAGQWDMVLATANAYRQARPDDSVVANAAGLLMLESGDVKVQESSLTMLRSVLDLRPTEPQSYLNLGVALNKLNRTSEAKEVFQQGLQAVPNTPILLMALGSLLCTTSEYDDAVAAYRQALELEPDNYRVLNDLSYILSENLKNPAEAEKLASKAIQKGVEDASLWDTWGVILYRLGRLDDSRVALEKSLGNPRIQPQTRQAATFHLARTLVQKDPARSRELLDRLLATPPAERRMAAADFEEAQRLLTSISTSQSSATAPPQ